MDEIMVNAPGKKKCQEQRAGKPTTREMLTHRMQRRDLPALL